MVEDRSLDWICKSCEKHRFDCACLYDVCVDIFDDREKYEIYRGINGEGEDGIMDLESIDADQMPEDAWEQRNEFSDSLYKSMKDMKNKEVNENITLNSILIAVLSYLWVDAEDDESFIKFTECFCESIVKTSKDWVERSEIKEDSDDS